MLLASFPTARETLRQLITKLEILRARFVRKQRQEEVADAEARRQELLALRARMRYGIRHRLESRDF